MQPLIKEAVKVVTQCARYKTARGQLQVAVEQATGKFSLSISILCFLLVA